MTHAMTKILNGDNKFYRKLAASFDQTSSSLAALVSDVRDRIRACTDSSPDMQMPSRESSLSHTVAMHSKLAELKSQEIELSRVMVDLILQQEQIWIDGSLTQALKWVDNSQSTERQGIWDMQPAS